MSSNDTEKSIRNAIELMKNEGVKISVYAVAKRAGVSNATIHNRYPGIRDEIAGLKERQSEPNRDKAANDVVKLKVIKEKHHMEAKAAKKREGVVLAHLMETYRLCDELFQENTALRQRVEHGEIVDFPLENK